METVLLLAALVLAPPIAFGDDDISTIGKFIIFGGGKLTDHARGTEEIVEIWSPDTPTRPHPLPTPHLAHQIATALPNRDALVCGGTPFGEPCQDCDDTCYILDLVTLRTTPAAPLPWDHTNYAAAALGTDVFLCGGVKKEDDDTWLARSECLRYRDGVWTETAPMREPRTGFALASNGSALYACGGQGRGENGPEGYKPGTNLKTCEVYDPKQDIWTPSSPLPTAATAGTMLGAVFGDDGRLYVVGKFQEFEKEMHIHDLVTGTWSKGPEMGPGVLGVFEVLNVNGSIWVFHEDEPQALEPHGDEWRFFELNLRYNWAAYGAVYVHPEI